MRMGVLTNSLFSIMVCASLIGCVPIPTIKNETPKVVGVLQSKGQVLQGYQMYFAHLTEESCSKKISKPVVTDARGQFQIDPTNQFHFVRWMVPTQSHSRFNLCVVSPEKEIKWVDILYINTTSRIPDSKLVCDYEKFGSKPLPNKQEQYFELLDICYQE